MGEIVSKTGVKYDTDYIFYIKGGDVWGSPRKKPGQPKAGKAKQFAATDIKRDNAYMYYVKRDGNSDIVVERVARQVGGSKRKAKSGGGGKKAAPKKAAPKKAAAKKTAKKPAKKSGGKKGKRK
ncbi:MAG: hypothetical protein ABI591_24945 [Kofleriaceae bacterium]